MTNKIFGVGYSKTGTHTLAACLKTLGFTHQKFDGRLLAQVLRGDPRGVVKLAASFDSFSDWPWPMVYRELDAAYPNSKFILTVCKDSPTWFASLKSQAEKHPDSPYRTMIFGRHTPHGHYAELAERYEIHNQAVREFFGKRPGTLLEVCWETGSGWDELCDFLGTPTPDSPLPHLNCSRPRGIRRVLNAARFNLSGWSVRAARRWGKIRQP